MKKKILVLFGVSTLLFGCNSVKTYLVGTYTTSKNEGINIIEFNEKTKNLKIQTVIQGVENPSFVIANKNKSIIIAVGETEGKKGGLVTSFIYDKESNEFVKVNSLNTLGNHPCTVAFSPDEDYVLVGNYTGGNLSVFKIDSNGKLHDTNQLIQYEGNSVNVERQEKPHVHSVVFHPSLPYVFVADLGRDAIEMIPYDNNSKLFLNETTSKSIKTKAGSGPRHMVFNREGTLLYVTYELTNEIGVFALKENTLSHIKTISLLENETVKGSSAELRISDDQKFLYASVRGLDNTIVVMKIDGAYLEIIQRITTDKTPRNFIISNDQRSVLVANQNSNSVVVYDRNIKTGLLNKTNNHIEISKPVYFYPL